MMFRIKDDILEEYAALAIEKGVNVQPGQPLEIRASVEAYELARKCAEKAYQKGSGKVTIEYLDEQKTRLDYLYLDEESLCDVPKWQLEKVEDNIKKGYCLLFISGSDPDLLAGLDSEKIHKASVTRMKAMQKYQYYSMNNIGQWSILAYPEVHWAHKVFPDIQDDDEAMEALWEAILNASRVEVNKTLSNWDIHNQEIASHAAKMNAYGFRSLHFINSLGTDLTVGLIKNHIWEGGCDLSRGDHKAYFNANIPTEELFTMPDRFHIDGKVVATKPLSYAGKIIDGFSFEFKDGKVVDFDAEQNKDVLNDLLDMDEGVRSLGEVALISFDSPISNSGILFYDTLFDENASCHLALGACYPTNVKNGTQMSSEELYELGGNDSMEHVDFMFGSADLQVDGIKEDGEIVPVFRDGNFVI